MLCLSLNTSLPCATMPYIVCRTQVVYLLGSDDYSEADVPADAFVIYQVRQMGAAKGGRGSSNEFCWQGRWGRLKELQASSSATRWVIRMLKRSPLHKGAGAQEKVLIARQAGLDTGFPIYRLTGIEGVLCGARSGGARRLDRGAGMGWRDHREEMAGVQKGSHYPACAFAPWPHPSPLAQALPSPR